MLRSLTAHYLLDGSASTRRRHRAGARRRRWCRADSHQLAKLRGLRVITTVSSDERSRCLARPVPTMCCGTATTWPRRYATSPQVRGDSGLRRRRCRHLRTVPGLDCGPGHGGAVRGGKRTGTAVRPTTPQRPGVAVGDTPTLAHFIADPDELAWRAGELFGTIAEAMSGCAWGNATRSPAPPKHIATWGTDDDREHRSDSLIAVPGRLRRSRRSSSC